MEILSLKIWLNYLEVNSMEELTLGNFQLNYFPVTISDLGRELDVYDKRALFIGAHPDDIEIGCSAKIKEMIEQEYAIFYAICTNGEAAQGIIPGERIIESQAAALSIGRDVRNRDSNEDWTESIEEYNEYLIKQTAGQTGISGVFYLNLPNNALEQQRDLVARLGGVILCIEPDELYTHSENDEHRDHVAVSKASITAAKDVSSILIMCCPRKTVNFAPNAFYPMNQFDWDSKSSLLINCFPSQVGGFIGDVHKAAKYFSPPSFKLFSEEPKYAEAFEVYRIVL